MNQYNYKNLQNGSDIRGVALHGVPGEDVNLGRMETFRIIRGFLLWLATNQKKEYEELCISIGHDSRLSAQTLKETIIETLLPFGVKVLDAGLASTPAMFMSTLFPEYNCDGAIMITASHLPYNRNGFKFFDKKGGLNKSDISEIISYAESDSAMASMVTNCPFGTNEPHNIPLIDTYSDHLKNKIIEEVDHPYNKLKPLQGLKIIVDAGNGAGGFYATKVLEPLGADINGSQFLNPDGNFPNHIPNPEDKTAMASISRAVVENKGDLGLIFDTDVDRSGAVDKSGNSISRNAIVAMAAALICDQHPNTTVVTDSITSDELSSFLVGELGVKHLRFKRGYKNVINKAIELNASGTDCQLAIETSGHAAYKENYFLDDGAYLATKIVIKAAKLSLKGKTIDSIIQNLKQPLESMEIRIPILSSKFSDYGDKVIELLTNWTTENKDNFGCSLVIPNYEGVRIAFNNTQVSGWCLIRKSLHDPIMPLNIESSTKGGTKIILQHLSRFLSQFSDLDTSKLK